MSLALTHFSLGTGARSDLTIELQKELLNYYHTRYPETCVTSCTAPSSAVNFTIVFLSNQAMFHDHVIYRGRRIKPSNFTGHAPDSIVQVVIDRCWYVGEIASILTHCQPRHNATPLVESLLHVRWLKPPKPGIVDTSIWDPL